MNAFDVSGQTDSSEHPAPAWLRYAFAVATVAAAVGLRFLSAPLIGDHVFVVFFPAVILAAWYGGGGPAAVASLLAVVSAHFFFFPPPFSLTPAPAAQAFQLALFLVAAGLVGAITSRLRDARVRAHETARQLDAVISSAVDGIIVIDGGGRILRANRAATAIFGYGSQDLVGRNVSMLMPEPDRRMEQARDRFLAAAGPALSRSLDFKGTLRELAELAVPDIADWCVVSLLDDGVILPAAICHRSTEHREALEQRLLARPPSLDATIGTGAVIRTGEPLMLRDVPREALEEAARDDADRRVLDQIALRSMIMVPLEARGERFGCLTLGQSTSGRRLEDADLALALELARRAGVAADNARLYERSEEERERAEAAASARDDLLAVVSHDLRQPLNILGGALSLLEQGILPRERHPAMFGRARRALEQANRLIEDLLDSARSRDGKIELAQEEVEVAEVAREVAGDLALHSDVEIDLGVAAPLGVISADRERLRRVLSNLLTNAIKHSTAGGRVSLHVIEDGGSILVRVSDAGQGIPPEDQPRVFDRYWRGKDASGGLGLGLAIAREIVEAHDGRIWLESEPGLGTTFFVKLPRSADLGTEGEEVKQEEPRSQRVAE